MTEEMKYYTGNCITDLHTDTSISYCNEEKCKQYIKSDGLKFCMSSVCPEKDCIYALVNKLHQTIDRLEQENKELKEENSLLSYNLHIKENEAAHYLKEVSRHRSALEEINRVVKLAYKVEDYLLGQDYTDLLDRIEKELEVLNEG